MISQISQQQPGKCFCIDAIACIDIDVPFLIADWLFQSNPFAPAAAPLSQLHLKCFSCHFTLDALSAVIAREAFDSFLGSYPPSLRTALVDRALEHLHEMRQVELSTVLHTLETSETIRTMPSVRRSQPSKATAGTNAQSANNQ